MTLLALVWSAAALAAMVVAREYEAMYVWGAQSGGARRLGVPYPVFLALGGVALAFMRQDNPSARRFAAARWCC